MTVCRIGLDTAKRVFQVHALDGQGTTVTTRRLRRTQVLDWFARLDRADDCVVGLEATGGAHYWARQLQRLGYRVRLLNPQAVKPYRQGQKTDARDAAALVEAVGREVVAETPIKTEEQQALLARQAYRRRLVNQRTALSNQLRGFLAEFGIVVGKGFAALKRRLAGRGRRQRPTRRSARGAGRRRRRAARTRPADRSAGSSAAGLGAGR